MSAEQSMLINEVAKYANDPLGFTLFAYPWGKGSLSGEKPLKWQSELMNIIKENLDNGVHKLRISVASGHGIGKTALMSQIIMWGMSTNPNTRVILTANTDTQLKTKTWPEVNKWYNSSITKDWFKIEATSLYSLQDGKKELWRCDRVNWSEKNPEAFAGAHNKGNLLLVLMDEASGIPDSIYDTIEGAMTDAGTKVIFLAFGNPTRSTGRFRETFRRYSKYWVNLQIDSRDVEITDKNELNQWIELHGVDSDFVKVRIRGLFPSQSSKQFISTDDVDQAYGRHLPESAFNFAPVIIGCDPAWEGDDFLTIGIRQGLMAKKLNSLPKNDNDMEIANLLARYEDEYKASAVFIDQGYGTGIYSAGKTMNRSWRLVSSASKSADIGCLNKRSEMWKSMRDWLKEGGAIPKDPKLKQQLEAPETVPRADGLLQIEPKTMIKKRLGESTDEADWLGLTFAYPVLGGNSLGGNSIARGGRVPRVVSRYNLVA
jgi:hypothetical protein